METVILIFQPVWQEQTRTTKKSQTFSVYSSELICEIILTKFKNTKRKDKKYQTDLDNPLFDVLMSYTPLLLKQERKHLKKKKIYIYNWGTLFLKLDTE